MGSGFHIENFGCRAARADGEAVGDRICAAGHRIETVREADVVIVNTCSVTEEADRAARAFIRRAHRLNPDARIMVTGCYAQRAPEELAGMAGVAAVVGNSHKALAPAIAMGLVRDTDQRSEIRDQRALAPEIAMGPARGTNLVSSVESRVELVSVQSLLSARTPGVAPVWVDDRFAHSFVEEAQVIPGMQTRPNLKIQEGCGNRCTFCVIPQTRGSSRSLPADVVLQQVERFVAAGGNELVLSGINLGRWGRDLAPGDRAPQSFSGLVRRILEETGLPRLRLSSIEPMDWDTDLIGLMRAFGGGCLARHAHLPLQSGCDGVLRRMHRRYRPWHYAAKVEALVAAAGPELTLGADVMAGFPGETDREFEESVEFMRALPFGYLHLFPFSPRPGTRGWALHAENPVPQKIVEERMAVMRALAAEKAEGHRRQFIGREVDAITLHTPREIVALGRTAGLTENFLPVEVEAGLPANQLVRIRITGLNPKLSLRADTSIAGRSAGEVELTYA
jgi:threonylcarbamoyladenosine tRNA methylthiotransferase MtaB